VLKITEISLGCIKS